jgi:hypothetical protein
MPAHIARPPTRGPTQEDPHDRSYIDGGTGKFKDATGYQDYFGMAGFQQNTLVLRYRGHVCYAS